MRSAPFIHSLIVDEWETTESVCGRALGDLLQTTLRVALAPCFFRDRGLKKIPLPESLL